MTRLVTNKSLKSNISRKSQFFSEKPNIIVKPSPTSTTVGAIGVNPIRQPSIRKKGTIKQEKSFLKVGFEQDVILADKTPAFANRQGGEETTSTNLLEKPLQTFTGVQRFHTGRDDPQKTTAEGAKQLMIRGSTNVKADIKEPDSDRPLSDIFSRHLQGGGTQGPITTQYSIISRKETGHRFQLPSASASSAERLSVMVDSTIHFLGKQEANAASDQRSPDIEVQNLSTDRGGEEPQGEAVIDIQSRKSSRSGKKKHRRTPQKDKSRRDSTQLKPA